MSESGTFEFVGSPVIKIVKGGHKDRKPRIRGQHTDAGREDRGQEDHREELPYNIELSDILGRPIPGHLLLQPSSLSVSSIDK
uniref:Uncharacterized protein n=1 Tax=Timema cristinae TaxID=61476 RepID=A0A7R9CEG1_TIMCR|nr:unnamed protein product [Timema cristinae]